MVLVELRIKQIPSYRENAGQYEGKAEFTDRAGDVALNLTPEMCNQIFAVCADAILRTAQEAAANLTCNVIEHQKALGKEQDNG